MELSRGKESSISESRMNPFSRRVATTFNKDSREQLQRIFRKRVCVYLAYSTVLSQTTTMNCFHSWQLPKSAKSSKHPSQRGDSKGKNTPIVIMVL